MTFNWPDVPFSGTEVDAFVVAYKAFAQEVLDAYNTSDHIYGESNGVEYLNLPYMTKENVKIYLEKALVYSAFVIKQRAGESGPGTDFELGNSPLNVELPSGEAGSLLKKLGCTWDNDSFDICFENGDNDNPDDKTLAPSDPPPEIDDVADGAAEDGDGDGPDDGNGPDDCPKTLSNYRGGGPKATNNGQSPDKSQLWQAYVGMLKTLGLGLLATGRGSLWTAGDMLGRYLSGVGGIYTGTGFVKPTLGVEINAYMNQNTSRVTERTPTAAEISGYGMGANDKIFNVDFYGYLWLGSAFGGAIVVAEGTTGNITYVKQVIDDYDFEYAYKIARGSGLPGLDLESDDSIESGPRLCQENIQRTVCGALTDAGPNYPSFSGLQYATRLPVAEAHGDGCVPFQEDRSSITGKPFPVRIQFSRASGNGL